MQMESSNLIALALIALAVSYWVFYVIIKAAVKSANEELVEQLKAMNMLKVMEMKKQGYNLETLRRLGGYYKQVNRMEKKKPYIPIDKYDSEKKRLEEIFN